MKDIRIRGYDIVGEIAIIKFSRDVGVRERKRLALDFLKKNKAVKTVLEKSDRFKGRLRTQTTKFLVGENTKEVLYRENGCVFRFHVDTCYFSPRLASERLDVATMVKKEDVLVMFGGVAPFAIVIAKHSKAEKIVSVELSRAASVYARENVKRNKVGDRVSIVQGDVRRVVPSLGKFDRIVMARPNLEDSFLDVAFSAVKKKGMIQYYGFYAESEKEKLKELIFSEAKKAKRSVKILRIEKAGNVGTRRYRWRADVKVN